MNNQKDTQRTSVNIYDKENVPDNKTLLNLPVAEIMNKRTEKLVTALYLVSDCMDEGDALKLKMRLLGVELLSDTFKLNISSPIENNKETASVLNKINELISLLEVGYNIGSISEMNNDIIRKEFNILKITLETRLMKENSLHISLDSRMFDLGLRNDGLENLSDKNHSAYRTIKDSNHTDKISPLGEIRFKKTLSTPNLTEKIDRPSKIISIVKEKKEASIKDIALAFTNCSEKTIQRDLNTLVSKGQIKKTGSKRWSKYSIIDTVNK